MSTPKVVIAGCGDVGSRLAIELQALGWDVQGLRRNIAALPEGISGIAADLFAAALPKGWPSGSIDYLVYCATPSQRDEAGYRQAYVEGLQHTLSWVRQSGQQPRRVVFVSSTGVYGQQQGEWIDETSATEAERFSGQVLLEAERVALDCGWPASVVRLAGIYGPGRSDLSGKVREGYRVAIDPPVYANRIHADDAAGLLAHLLKADAEGVVLQDCYLGVDDEPAALAEVVAWMREYLGVSQWSEQQVLRRAGSKRCSNARARALGWTPRYPDYRAGYAALLG
ncbi:SDR family oxidoreductase [Pseudomonas sp. LJDD11]|uniref:SDR family oxidoreductase n=1 Tax=unclassified Pseudomonas TaxID=196821 RepID=UPI0004F91B6E|nr:MULTISPECIES: SDR family oxidoreductase [unclassified Pseudomonas]MCO8162503.1 SDR family oxidoreductase [Pseudomonas sp. 21LCFQ010]MCQ9425891.1 SDR family oxidoreductase [Pseudomonas sp. LJDD11]BAP42276.1 ActC family protein [Pseudomonas sp. StFLB209]